MNKRSEEITNYFLYYKIENNKRLVSGNIWGTEPGRSFNFDLITHKFFDFSTPRHSGQGFKKLFLLRNEPLPDSLRSTYRSAKIPIYDATAGLINDKSRPPVYEPTPLPEIPYHFTQPSKITLWEINKQTGNKEKISVSATAYLYKNAQGSRIGYIMRGIHPITGTKLIRPLTVWNRVLDNGKVLPCYRQKAFDPILYNLDQIYTFPQKIVLVVEGEKCAKFGTARFKDRFVFTTWPFGVQSFNSLKIWEPLRFHERVVLWPDNDAIGIEVMKEIQKRFLPKALVLNPERLGLKDKEDIADIDDLTRLTKIINFIYNCCNNTSEIVTSGFFYLL